MNLVEMFEEVAEMTRRLPPLPPRPYCFMADHRVPYGRVFRQWDTRGRLLVWVNRAYIDGIVRTDNPSEAFMLAAIPVVVAKQPGDTK